MTDLMTIRPPFCSIEQWCALSGMGRRWTYGKLGTGDLKAVKAGSRTLIDVEAGLAYLRSCPPARIRPVRAADQNTAADQRAAAQQTA